MAPFRVASVGGRCKKERKHNGGLVKREWSRGGRGVEKGHEWAASFLLKKEGVTLGYEVAHQYGIAPCPLQPLTSRLSRPMNPLSVSDPAVHASSPSQALDAANGERRVSSFALMTCLGHGMLHTGGFQRLRATVSLPPCIGSLAADTDCPQYH